LNICLGAPESLVTPLSAGRHIRLFILSNTNNHGSAVPIWDSEFTAGNDLYDRRRNL